MRVRYAAFLMSFLGSLTAHAGSVSSGGGKFIGTEFNPWFLENVSTVSYCVDVDPAAFRPGERGAKDAVRYAIDKWKATFAAPMLNDGYYRPGQLSPYGDVRLATQTYSEVDCAGPVDVDLRFQFGHLTADQEAYLPDAKDYIGVAVRTDYDLKTLRGKGFIYIAADAGPNRPTEPSFAPDPWSADSGAILKTVLLHELGHTFGLRHESGRNHIMSDGFIDMIVERDFVQAVSENPGVMDEFWLSYLKVFNYDPNRLITECDEYSVRALASLFLLNNGTRCVKLQFSHNETGDNKFRIRVSSAPAESGPYYEEGVLTSIEGFSGNARPIIELKISDDQRVFSRLPDDLWGNRLMAAYEKVTERRFTATYVNDAGQVVPNLFGFINEVGDFQLGAYRNGRIDLNIYNN